MFRPERPAPPPPPERPAGVPEDAVWVQENKEWEHGARSSSGARRGVYTRWGPDGLTGRYIYDEDGRLDGESRRFHPNGELAWRAFFVHGAQHGVESRYRACDGVNDWMHVVDVRYPPEIMQEDTPFHHGQQQAIYRVFYNQAGHADPVPCDERGRSIGLEHHLHKVVQRSALLPVASSVSTTSGHTLPLLKDAYFTYLGPREEAVSIQVREGRKKTRYVVSADALGRAFTLAASYYISMTEARRPTAVPAGAYFDEVDRQWVFGRRHGSTKLGAFQFWRRDGSLSAQLEYREDGIVHGPFVHYHPDGTVACEGRYEGGVLHGTTTYQRCAGATKQKFPHPHHSVWRLETDHDRGRETARRYFSRSGAMCDAKGQAR